MNRNLNYNALVQVCQQLSDLVKEVFLEELGVGLTPSDAAAALQVPLAIAVQHLRTAESAGVLCRDEGPEGIKWYRNFFADAAASVTA